MKQIMLQPGTSNSSQGPLYVDKDGYQGVISQLNQICTLLSPLGAQLSQTEGTGINALCDRSIVNAVAQCQTLWSAAPAIHAALLNEISGKMVSSLHRYEATDTTNAQYVDKTVEQVAEA